MEIFSFKLISGEEIIAKVIQKPLDTDIAKNYIIERPMVLMLAEVSQGKVMPVPVAPWILLAKESDQLTLSANLIMHTNTNVPKPIEDYYIRSISSIVV